MNDWITHNKGPKGGRITRPIRDMDAKQTAAYWREEGYGPINLAVHSGVDSNLKRLYTGHQVQPYGAKPVPYSLGERVIAPIVDKPSPFALPSIRSDAQNSKLGFDRAAYRALPKPKGRDHE